MKMIPHDTKYLEDGSLHPNDKRLYLHLIDYPFGNLSMPSLSGKIKYAQFLQDASEIIFSDKDENCVFNLPTVLNVQEIPVIEVFLK